MRWNALIHDYGLESNEWLAYRYHIRESWIPTFFMDISLAGVLRTTLRPESSKSFFQSLYSPKIVFC
jgi:hypothetical protein